MRHCYSTYIANMDNCSIAKIVPLMMEQARIATRQKRERWKLELNDVSIDIWFLHKRDRYEFNCALVRTEDYRRIEQQNLIFTEDDYWTATEWTAYAQRLWDEC